MEKGLKVRPHVPTQLLSETPYSTSHNNSSWKEQRDKFASLTTFIGEMLPLTRRYK